MLCTSLPPQKNRGRRFFQRSVQLLGPTQSKPMLHWIVSLLLRLHPRHMKAGPTPLMPRWIPSHLHRLMDMAQHTVFGQVMDTVQNMALSIAAITATATGMAMATATATATIMATATGMVIVMLSFSCGLLFALHWSWN